MKLASSLPANESNVFLLGFMGAGKTTVGRVLATNSQRDFFDTDRIIEEQQGMPVEEIFAKMGERQFRELEKTIVEAVSKESGAVIALGGGAVTVPHNWNSIRRSGVSVYLHWSIGELLGRLMTDQSRPLIRSANADSKRAKIRKLYHSRTSLYEQADYKIACHQALSPQQIAQRIVETLLI